MTPFLVPFLMGRRMSSYLLSSGIIFDPVPLDLPILSSFNKLSQESSLAFLLGSPHQRWSVSPISSGSKDIRVSKKRSMGTMCHDTLWCGIQMGSEIRTNGRHCVENHLKSRQKHQDFEWSGFLMGRLQSPSEYQTPEYWTVLVVT